jgi:hypothetical protein
MSVPRIFYKYRSLSGKNREYVHDTIINNNVYLASPDSFNDPFDCAPAFLPIITPNGAYALARRYLSRTHPRWGNEKIEISAKAFVAQTSRADMAVVAQGLRDGYESVRQWLAIYAVSGTGTSALMWSLYADSHRGVCIGFASDVDIFAKAQSVAYSRARHTVDPVHDSDEQRLVNSLLLKSADWKYEKEWRFIEYERGPGVHHFESPVIREIILGSRISATDEYRVLDWVNQLETKPHVYHATISPDHFKIDLQSHGQT